jgi:hypothetical protein
MISFSFILLKTYIIYLYYYLCLVYPMLPVSLDFAFLIAPSVYSNISLHLRVGRLSRRLTTNFACTYGYRKFLFVKNEGAIRNAKSRDTGNIGYTRHRTKSNKTKQTTQKTKKMRNTDTTKYRVLTPVLMKGFCMHVRLS